VPIWRDLIEKMIKRTKIKPIFKNLSQSNRLKKSLADLYSFAIQIKIKRALKRKLGYTNEWAN